jgi:hypothetical protein
VICLVLINTDSIKFLSIVCLQHNMQTTLRKLINLILIVIVFFLRNLEALNNLWRLRDEFTDATIFANNSKDGIKVHKLILAAASPYLQRELKKSETVRLTQIDLEDLQLIIEYIYKGNIQIAADEFERFQEKAKLLSINIRTTGRKEPANSKCISKPLKKKQKKMSDASLR